MNETPAQVRQINELLSRLKKADTASYIINDYLTDKLDNSVAVLLRSGNFIDEIKDGLGLKFIIKELGGKVLDCGGWVEYHEKQTNKAKEEGEMDYLKKRNLELSNENSEYQKTIRAKDESIKTLTEEKLKIDIPIAKTTRTFQKPLAIIAGLSLLANVGQLTYHIYSTQQNFPQSKALQDTRPNASKSSQSVHSNTVKSLK